MADKENVLAEPRNSDSIVLDSCCCCVPLKTGCLILGYLQLVLFILSGIMSIVGIVGGLALMYSDKDEEYQKIGFVLLIMNVVFILICIFTLPFTILLLVGLHKDNRKFIKIYLIYSVICLSIYIVSSIAWYSRGYSSVKDLITTLIGIALNIYFFLVLRSHHIKLGWENNTNMGYHGGQVLTQKP